MVQKPVRGSVRHEIGTGDLDKITNSIGVGLARQVGCHLPMNHCMSNKPRHSICFLFLKNGVWMYCFPHITFGRDVLTSLVPVDVVISSRARVIAKINGTINPPPSTRYGGKSRIAALFLPKS